MKVLIKSNSKGMVCRFFLLAAWVLIFSLVGCGGGGSSNNNNNDGNVVTPNDPPVANASAPAVVDERTPAVTLDGTGSTDSDGNITSYSWTQLQGPAVNITNADADVAQFVAPAVSAQTELIFRLTVTDNDGDSDTDDVTVNVDNAGNLYVSVAEAPDTVDLEVEGGLDWSHWGLDAGDPTSFNQKEVGGVPADLIGDYADFGGAVTATQFSSGPIGVTWSNGSDTATVSDPSTTGLFFSTPLTGPGEGIQLIIPADAADKTLRLYIGTTSLEGELTATLSDGTPPVTVTLDNTLSVGKVRVVTIDFGAELDGETLTVNFTNFADTGADAGGALDLVAATLANATATTPAISRSGGTSGSVEVTLDTGTSDATIRYSTDDSDPDSNSTLFTGPFTLTASATVKARAFFPGFNQSAIAAADFEIITGAGSLAASVENAPDTVDLEVEGGLDWSHWGLDAGDPTSFNQKEVGGVPADLIGDYADFGGAVTATQFSSGPIGVTWSNGSDTATVSDPSTTGLFFSTPLTGPGEGIQLIIPADAADKTLRLYIGTTSLEGELTATLSDGTPPVTVTLDNTLSVGKVRVVTIDFGAELDGESLTVNFTNFADTGADAGGALNLMAATLF